MTEPTCLFKMPTAYSAQGRCGHLRSAHQRRTVKGKRVTVCLMCAGGGFAVHTFTEQGDRQEGSP